MNITQDGALAAGVVLFVATAVAVRGHSTRCPRCGGWFLGKIISTRRESHVKSVGAFRPGRGYERKDERRTTTYRDLTCRRCGHSWETVDGAIRAPAPPPADPAPAPAPAPPPAPVSWLRQLRIAVCGLGAAAAALALVARADWVGVSGDHLVAAAAASGAIVVLGLEAVVFAALGLMDGTRLQRAFGLLLALMVVLPVTFEAEIVAWAAGAQRAIDARWAEAREAGPEALERYLELEHGLRSSLDALEAAPKQFGVRGPSGRVSWCHRLAVERGERRAALASDDPARCKRHHRAVEAARFDVSTSWRRGPERDQALAELDAHDGEVRARLAALRQEAGRRYRALAEAAPGADPAGVALIGSILEGRVLWAADQLAVELKLGDDRPKVEAAGNGLAPERLRLLEERAAARAVATLADLARRALGRPVLLERAEPAGTPRYEAFLRSPAPAAPDALAALGIRCAVTPAGSPPRALDVAVEARLGAWVRPETFRVEADAADPEAAWAALLERACDEAVRRVALALGLPSS